MRKVEDQDLALRVTNGTSLKGHIFCYYAELLQLFGEPTFPDQSDKVQKEWVIEHKGSYYTIYDWNNPSEGFVMYQNQEWNIGGNQPAYDFIIELEQMLETQRFNNYIEEQEASLVYFLN